MGCHQEAKRQHVYSSRKHCSMTQHGAQELEHELPLLRSGLTIAADSCSLIFLGRMGLLQEYRAVHTILLTRAVYDEVTRVPLHAATGENRKPCTELLCVNVADLPVPATSGRPMRAGLSAADRSIVDAYHCLHAAGILTDDKAVCRHCRHQAIPYINTPMALFVLLYHGRLSHNDYTDALRTLYGMGRYGQFVHDYMDTLYRRYRAGT